MKRFSLNSRSSFLFSYKNGYILKKRYLFWKINFIEKVAILKNLMQYESTCFEKVALL